MLLYSLHPRASTLLPNACDASWTDLTRVLSDNPPPPAGLGAAQIAQDALGISPGAAAAMVAAAGGSRGGAASAAASVAPPRPRANNGVRLPITPTVNTGAVFLNGDPNRGFLLVQNNNSSGNANLLVSIDAPIDTSNPGFYLNLAPGLGILLDDEMLINPLYVAWVAGGTVDLGGVCIYGSAASAGPARSMTRAQQATTAQLEQSGQTAAAINEDIFGFGL